jgi:ubiquinone/menaquinone biosynthesis C-methylase UbiE
MQKAVFLTGEGDAYFDRNSTEFVADGDPVIAALGNLSVNHQSILEVGCGCGGRTAALAQTYNAKGCGVDPSSKAIAHAAARYPGVDFKVGTADSLPFPNDQFDLVIFGFCLYLCDPDDYFGIISEANRVLRDRGFIVIFDFIADHPFKNIYHHKPGLHSYKMTWSNMFTCHPSYTLVARHYAEMRGKRTFGFNELVTVDIVRKDRSAAFPDRGNS